MNKKLLSAIAMVGAAAFNTQATPVLGPTGSYYDVISSQGIDWNSAEAAALGSTYNGMNGHLVTITSAVEDSFVLGLVHGEYWAGGFQNPITETTANAGWTWVNGEGSFVYQNWNSGEPNDNTGPGSEQYMGIGWAEGKWNDEGALGNIQGYVVEYSGVPDAGSSMMMLGGAFVLVGAIGRRFRK